MNEGPYLIQLQTTDADVVNLFGEDLFATFTGEFRNVQHGSLFHIAQASGTAHAIAFHQTM